MEERPPGGVPGDVDGDSGDISGWLSSSSVVGGTVGPQRMDITERILRDRREKIDVHQLTLSASTVAQMLPTDIDMVC